MKTGAAPCRPGLWKSVMRPLTCAHLPPPEERLTLPCPRSPNAYPGTSSCPLKATLIFGRCV